MVLWKEQFLITLMNMTVMTMLVMVTMIMLWVLMMMVVGAMVAMTVFNGDEAKSKAFTMKLFENGVLSFMAGGHPTTRVRFLMPVMVTEEWHIDEVCQIIEKTLKEME
jgi:acetylornithine/succinyldiaminopimelate/putrescine aminotransferase